MSAEAESMRATMRVVLASPLAYPEMVKTSRVVVPATTFVSVVVVPAGRTVSRLFACCDGTS